MALSWCYLWGGDTVPTLPAPVDLLLNTVQTTYAAVPRLKQAQASGTRGQDEGHLPWTGPFSISSFMISFSWRVGVGWGGEYPSRVKLQPSGSLTSALHQVQTYTGTKAVGRSDLVDVIVMDMAIGTAGSGLALAPAHGPAVHHAAGRLASLVLLTAREWVAVVRHNPGGAAGRSKCRVNMVRHNPGPPAGCRAILRPPLHASFLARALCCSPSTSQEPPGTIETSTMAALLVVRVTRQQVLG